ncbi:MAG: sigma factor-like helix-turn-helix DNA-binding protein [Bacteroidia bacterium]|nr:sigma factor-like helix-turn-helix DNA-binding protein [Bacteroidia bacterium]
MLAKLPDLTQKIFNLFAIDGYKHKEIGDYLGIPIGTSKWHVNDARKRLKVMLEKQVKTEKRLAKLK